MPFGCFRQNDNEYQYYYSCNYHITSIFTHTKSILPESMKDYNSKINPLTKEELKNYLQSYNLL